MKSIRQAAPGLVVGLAVASALCVFEGGAWASESVGPLEHVGVEQDASDAAGGYQKSWWQKRLERRRTRAEIARVAKPPAPRDQGAPGAVSLSLADLADLQVSFKLDPRLTSGLYMGVRWVSPPTYSGVQEGEFRVEARVEGRDAKGQPVDVQPEWIPADPRMVTVSPPQGKAVTITVHRAGQSSIRVVQRIGESGRQAASGSGSDEPSVSTELSISAGYQGTALEAQLTPSGMTTRQGGPKVTNGWRFVDDGDQPVRAPSRPTVRNGWSFVDGDAPGAGTATKAQAPEGILPADGK